MLALLVVGSFALLTFTYGQSSNGVQHGVSAIFSPFQDVADRALKPARDLVNWFDKTFAAKGENDKLKTELGEARREIVGAKAALGENRQLKGLVKLNGSGAIPSGYNHVAGRVTFRSPTVWFADVTIDVGSGDGVAVGDPVVNGDGPEGALVGTVTAVDGGSSKVTLIADGTSNVAARVVPLGSQGMISAKVGEPSRLILDFIDSTKTLHKGQDVVTSGWRGSGIEANFPPNIPIGKIVQSLDPQAGGPAAGRSRTLRRPPQPRHRRGPDRGLAQVILTPKIVARVVLICLLAVLLQLSFFSRVTVFQISPDVLPAVVVSLGLLGGSLTGAVSGFSIGFLVDCLLVLPLGGSSLVLLASGYLAGLFRERFEIRSVLLPPLLIMVLTLFAELGFGAIALTLGIDGDISPLVVRDMLVKSLYSFFLAWPVYYGIKRALRPALVEDRAMQGGGGRGGRPTVLGA